MQPGATRVGPSREPSVRRIAVRFLSGATISMKKMIKAQFFRSLSGPPTKRLATCSSQNACQHGMRNAGATKRTSKQRDGNVTPWAALLLDNCCPPKFRRRLREFGEQNRIAMCGAGHPTRLISLIFFAIPCCVRLWPAFCQRIFSGFD